MSTVAISTPFNISLNFEIAPFHKRLFAFFIDLLIITLYSSGIREIFAYSLKNNFSHNIGIDIFLIGVPAVFYHLVMEVFNNGQSPGKLAMSIKVMSLQGGEPHIGQYLMRWIFRVFEWFPLLAIYSSFFYAGYNLWYIQIVLTGVYGLIVVLIIAVSKKSQRLGDMAAGTTVVQTKMNMSLSDTIFQEVETAGYKVFFPEVMRLSDRDINAIKAVLKQASKSGSYDTAHRVAQKIKDVLKIKSDLDVADFLEKLLADYNYVATKE